MHLGELIQNHGYWLAFVGALLEGETLLSLGGLAAHRGYLQFLPLAALGAAGGFIGDQAYFFLGRRAGMRVLERFPQLKPPAERVTDMVDRHPISTIFTVRFLYGLRTAGPVAIGMSRVHWATYTAVNAVGAAAWSTCWVGAGYLLGDALQAMLGHLAHIEHWLFAGILGIGFAAFLWRRRNRRASLQAADSRSASQS